MEYSIKRINNEERNLPESYMHPQVLDLFKVERVYIGEIEEVPTEWKGKSVLVYHNGYIVVA